VGTYASEIIPEKRLWTSSFNVAKHCPHFCFYLDCINKQTNTQIYNRDPSFLSKSWVSEDQCWLNNLHEDVSSLIEAVLRILVLYIYLIDAFRISLGELRCLPWTSTQTLKLNPISLYTLRPHFDGRLVTKLLAYPASVENWYLWVTQFFISFAYIIIFTPYENANWSTIACVLTSIV
jgi:hypothetical protein